jgi:hypothetical protein
MQISKTDRNKLARCLEDGISVKEMAAFLSVSESTIRRALKGANQKTLDERADMMEAMLGGATVDDGCYDASVPKNTIVPDSQVDNNDPLSILLAEEEANGRR